jgi:predicted RNase H-related nuclease YkuK (DUF458 family)
MKATKMIVFNTLQEKQWSKKLDQFAFFSLAYVRSILRVRESFAWEKETSTQLAVFVVDLFQISHTQVALLSMRSL